jgi:hypothetical protein
LRAHSTRSRGRRAAEQRDEFATFSLTEMHGQLASRDPRARYTARRLGQQDCGALTQGGSEPSTCFAGAHSPWPPPLAPPTPLRPPPQMPPQWASFALFAGFTAVESGEVGHCALPLPARSNGSCGFPASRFPVQAPSRLRGRFDPPVPTDASRVSSMPAQGLSQSELVRTSVMYSPVLRCLALPHSTGPSPSARPFGSVRRRHSTMTIRDLLL